MLWFMGSQRVGHSWVTELKLKLNQKQSEVKVKCQLFSCVNNWMWELDYKESWAPKNWCFWTGVLVKNLESPLDCKEIQPVHLKGDQSWVFIGRTNVEAETPVLWPHEAKSWLIWKALRLGNIEGGRRKGWQKIRWLDGITDSMDV